MKTRTVVKEYPSISIDELGIAYSERTGKPLTIFLNRKGYGRVSHYDPAKKRSRLVSVHKLVCLVFHGPKPSPTHQVRHLDGVKTNNTPLNVCWGTPMENSQDRIRHGNSLRGDAHPLRKKPWLILRGERQNNAKLNSVKVASIKVALLAGTPRKQLASKYVVSVDLISGIANNKMWTHIPWTTVTP